MANADWGSVEPFGVDDGELDGLMPAEIFVLGVEWEMIAALADQPEGFERNVHRNNQDRIRAILDRRQRVYQLTFQSDDVSESWLWLTVDPSPRA